MLLNVLHTLVDVGTGLAAIGAGFAIAVGGGCSGIGEGNICAKGVEGIARNPEADGKIRTGMILGCALDETTGIYSLLVAILIIFVMK
ncbi:MAG: ATP synthase F0 subunit C [Firmicutes bacterium]|nr:ATP synthase F0 subunit C [Bacillota bacterium]